MFKNLGIKTKLLLGFSTILLFSLVLAGVVFYVMNEADNGINEYRRFSKLKKELKIIENNLHNLDLSIKDHLLLNRDENKRAVDRYLDESTEIFRSISFIENDYINESLSFAEESYNDYLKSIGKLNRPDARGSYDEGHIFALNSHRSAFLTAAGDIYGYINEIETQIDVSITGKFTNIFTLLIIGSVVFAVSLIIFVLFFSTSISKPISFVSSILSEISEGEGDLVKRLPVESRDELGSLSLSFNRFAGKLHQIIARLKEAVEGSGRLSVDLAANSEEISAALEEARANLLSIAGHSHLLHEDAEKVDDLISASIGEIANIRSQVDIQTSCVSESTASIEELIASIKNLSQVSEEKSVLASDISETSDRSMDIMKRAFESMREVSVSVVSIQDFIKIINKVASQTRLLAMNAAIEAAHAGDAGRGFSVVADEIRKLSEATSANARDISSNLKSLIGQISGAAELNSRLEESMSEVTGGIQSVTDSFKEMNMSLLEMSAGTNEISAASTALVNSAELVNGSVVNIESNIEDVSDSFNDIRNLTLESSQSIDELSKGITEISSSMAMIAGLGEENSRNIQFIDTEISRFKTLNINGLTASDGQPLIVLNEIRKNIPPRPVDRENLSETDSDYWYDYEYAGWNIEKKILPPSKGDGIDDKRICCLLPGDHPYMEAYERGMKTVAEEYGLIMEFYTARWSADIQEKQIQRAVEGKPDLIVLLPTDAERSVEWFKGIHQSGIPVIASNLFPHIEAFPYLLSWTGPDDWRQVRLLAKKFSELMNFEGGYCILQHIKGSSAYYSRTYGHLTELHKIAPSMKCLAIEETHLSRELSREAVEGLIDKYGDKLKGIICADDSDGLQGVNEALFNKGRTDIIRIASGNSSAGMTCLQEGSLHATNYQPAESDGALPIKIACDWFNGLDVDPVNYLPVKILTRENVTDYLPAHW